VYKIVFSANDVGRAATVAVITVFITLSRPTALRAIKKRRGCTLGGMPNELKSLIQIQTDDPQTRTRQKNLLLHHLQWLWPDLLLPHPVHFLTGFNTEIQAVNPALFFKPTCSPLKWLSDPDMILYLTTQSSGVASTLICFAGVPAASRCSFRKFKMASPMKHVQCSSPRSCCPRGGVVQLYLTFTC
jgi:hypothetical protein